jgi:ribose transport system permease protein
MKKLIGIFTFLLVLYVFILIATDPARWGSNHFNLGQRIGLAGILCLGAGLLIVTGGVDLSIGSVVGLCACVFCLLVLKLNTVVPDWLPVDSPTYLTPLIVFTLSGIGVLLLGAFVGFLNGVIVAYLRVQAFVVTLCGLFLYRGIARWVSKDEIPRIASSVSDLNAFFTGELLYLPVYLWLLLLLFAIATVFLHLTIHGRYFYAIGSNERAARYSGINVEFYRILAYVLCSTFAAIYAIIHVIHFNSVVPSETGSFLELYAIAGAVLGGCSLRGGEGATMGMLIGTAILVLLPNLTNMWGIRSELEPTVVGAALLLCAVLDELLRRRDARQT